MSSDTGKRNEKPGNRWVRFRRKKKVQASAAATAVVAVALALASVYSPFHKDHAPAIGATGKAALGMSAPASDWDTRLSEVQAKGGHIQARRIFVSGFGGSLNLATQACNDGQIPVISYKESPYTPTSIASGAADNALRTEHTRLMNLPCSVFVTIHHEPASDMTASQYTNMLVHALPILGGTLDDQEIRVGPIGNGWWFNTNSQGYSDAELDQWVGPTVRGVSDFIAADTYQGKTTAEGVASKINRMAAWGTRVNNVTPSQPVRVLGLGEWNVQSAQAITDACEALGTQPLFSNGFGNLWNNDGTGSANAHVLTGDMLTAFQNCVSTW